MHSSYHREEEEVQHEYLDGKRSFYRETRHKQLCILGIQDATIPCRPRLLELHWRSTRKSTQPNTCRPPSLGASVESCAILPCIMHSWSRALLHLKGQNAKEAWGNLKRYSRLSQPHESFNSAKSWTIFNRGIYQSATTPWRSRIVQLPRVDQCQHWRRRNGADMTRWPSTTSKQEAMHLTYIWSTQIQTKEEEKFMEEGANQAKAETTKGNLLNVTSTTSKTLQTCGSRS